MSIKIYQGDSSDLLTLTPSNSTITLDDDWEASLAVLGSESEINTPLISKNFSKNAAQTKFVTFITPEESATLSPGTYYIGMEVKNDALNFRKEVHDKLIVKQQRVSNS